jgi:histidyl-tRNA synthetase
VHFSLLCERLDNLGIKYTVNPSLVRGLDYYNRTVFEWVTDLLGAQGTICAGGRYDGLVEQLGGKTTPAVGFAMGLERLVLLVESLDGSLCAHSPVDVYIMAIGDEAESQVMQIAEKIRSELPSLKVQQHFGGGNFKKQMKKAIASDAPIALIIEDGELKNANVSVKYLKQDKPQARLSLEALSALADLL